MIRDNSRINNFVKLILLFLLGLNFMNNFFIIAPVFILFVLVSEGSMKIKKKAFICFLLLLIFIIVYIYVYEKNGNFTLIKLVVYLTLPFMYLSGFLSNGGIGNWKDQIWAVIIGLALHGCLNLFYNRSLVLSGVGSRTTIDFWTKQEWIITGQISLFILIAGCTYYILFYMKSKNKKQIFLITLLFLGIIYNVMTATRTVIYAVILNIALCVFIEMLFYKRDLKMFIRYSVGLLALTLTIYFLYSLNLFHIRTVIESTPLLKRIELLNSLNSGLSDRQLQVTGALQQFFDYPFGGYAMQFSPNYEFLHNAWLNVNYATGYVPCVLFVWYSVILIMDCKKTIGVMPKEDVIFVIGLYTAVFVYLYLEPVFEIYPSFMALFCYINGCVKRQLLFSNSRILEEPLGG